MIPERNPYNNWNGNGQTTTFDFDFYIEDETQLVVYHTNASGVQTTLTYGTDYSINEFKNENGSFITFPLSNSSYSVLGEGEIISLCLTLPISQENEYGKSSYLDLKAIEYSLDYLTRICQIINRQMERSVKTQEGSSQSASELIEALQEAQVNAAASASSAASSATAAQNSAISAGDEATIATQKAAEVSETYTTAMSDIEEARQTSLNDIETSLAGAEANIEADRENALSDISTTKTNAVNNIQALGMYMEGDRLFYFDTNGVKHEFRNDYGGIAPMPVKHKEIKEVENGYELTWSDPDDSVYQNNVYCTWGNTVIVRKEGSYPESAFDGDVVVNSTIRNQYAEIPYLDEVDTTKDYKYRAFPCSINKVYSLDELNKFGVWIYSYKRIKSESVPSEKIEYYGTNEHYKPAYMDFSSDTYKYEDWLNAPFLSKERLAPCMVYNTDATDGENNNLNGQVAYFLNRNNYKQKEDGTASDVTNTAMPMNAFMRIKLLYRRKKKDASGNTYVDISNEKVNEDYKAYGGFVKPDGTLREYIFLPIYRGSLVNNKCRSMSGGLTPMSSQTAQSERTYCQNNGAGHDMITEADRELIEDLFLLMHKTTDSQSALGQGKSDGGSSVAACLVSGTMDEKGLNWGSTSTSLGIKFLGMENRYASQWERILGDVLVNGVHKVKKCQGTSDGSTVEDFNFTGEGYIALTELPTISGTSGGYISEERTVDDIGTYPVVVSGSSTTHECDGMWFNNSGTMVAIRGGGSAAGALCGVFCSNLDYAASDANWHIGSSVSYKPL